MAMTPESNQSSRVIGGFVVEPGGHGGTTIVAAQRDGDEEAAELGRALDTDHDQPQRSKVRALADGVDTAANVGEQVARAEELFVLLRSGGLGLGDIRPEIDRLLDKLAEFDRSGRTADALALARAIERLLVLIGRWDDVADTLSLALRAATELGDDGAIAWTHHEIGTLQLAAGRPQAAERNLEHARQLRAGLGDRRSLAATERNLQTLCERLRTLLRDGALQSDNGTSRRVRRSPVLLVLLAVLLLGAGGVAGATIVGGDGDNGTTTETEASSGSGGGPDDENREQPREMVSFRVDFAGEGAGTVTSVPRGIECSRACDADFPRGRRVELTATAADGSTFVGWEGAGCSGTDRCTVRLDRTSRTTARFSRTPPGEHVLAVDPARGGQLISVPPGISCPEDCQGVFAAGSTVTLRADADEGFEFKQWLNDCADTAGTGPCTVTMEVDRKVSASFAPRRTLTVTADTSSGNGTVTSTPAGIACPGQCRTQFSDGTRVVLTGSPAPAQWGGDCSGVARRDPCSISMDTNRSVTAIFGPL